MSVFTRPNGGFPMIEPSLEKMILSVLDKMSTYAIEKGALSFNNPINDWHNCFLGLAYPEVNHPEVKDRIKYLSDILLVDEEYIRVIVDEFSTADKHDTEPYRLLVSLVKLELANRKEGIYQTKVKVR